MHKSIQKHNYKQPASITQRKKVVFKGGGHGAENILEELATKANT